MRSACSGGMTTTASATCAVLPAVAADDAVDRRADPLASSRARTRLGEMLRSVSPPPTEKTSSASSGRSRDTSSQAEKVVSQPSSLVRAVSSLTLSVGA